MKALSVVIVIVMMLAAQSASAEEVQFLKYREVVQRPPDLQGRHARVCTVKKDAISRIVVVEMAGEVPLHQHPDASHTIMVPVAAPVAPSKKPPVVTRQLNG